MKARAKIQAIAPSPALAWKPATMDDLIGQPGEIGRKLLSKVQRMRELRNGSLKLLLIGPPGIGKTSIVDLLARELGGTPWAVDDSNGKSVTIETVKIWTAQLPYGCLYSDWSIKVVNELDRCSRDAQDLMLSYLDKLPAGKAFLGTSNLDLNQLTERLQTRFQVVRLKAPKAEEISTFLKRHWEAPEAVINMIALGSGGNVRAALADLENYFDSR